MKVFIELYRFTKGFKGIIVTAEIQSAQFMDSIQKKLTFQGPVQLLRGSTNMSQ